MLNNQSRRVPHQCIYRDSKQLLRYHTGNRIPMDALKMLKTYYNQNLGDFYAHATNRMLVYPFFFSLFLVECGTFWLLYLGPGFVLDFLAFTTVYTLHKAGVYTISIFFADILAHHLTQPRGAYGKRTVGRQWLI